MGPEELEGWTLVLDLIKSFATSESTCSGVLGKFFRKCDDFQKFMHSIPMQDYERPQKESLVGIYLLKPQILDWLTDWLLEF